jgi:hypothetical protein
MMHGPHQPGALGDPCDGFHCTGCGNWHPELPLSFHTAAPDAWSATLAGTDGNELGSYQCVMHGKDFFIRALIQVPIVDDDRVFESGVWVSLSEDDFFTACETWETPGREASAPMFGWLCTELPTYAQSTIRLRTMVHTQPVGLRPLAVVESTDHALAVEQREGVDWPAVTARVTDLLHPA